MTGSASITELTDSIGIVLSGGFGTRMSGAYPNLPKGLVPLQGKPLIEYVIETCLGVGVNQVVVAGGYRFDQLKSHLNVSYPSDRVSIVDTGEGADIIDRLKQIVCSRSFKSVLVTYGDSLVTLDVEIVNQFLANDVLSVGMFENVVPYGVWQFAEAFGKSKLKLHQKTFTYAINSGYYTIPRGIILEILDNYGDFEFGLTELMNKNINSRVHRVLDWSPYDSPLDLKISELGSKTWKHF